MYRGQHRVSSCFVKVGEEVPGKKAKVKDGQATPPQAMAAWPHALSCTKDQHINVTGHKDMGETSAHPQLEVGAVEKRGRSSRKWPLNVWPTEIGECAHSSFFSCRRREHAMHFQHPPGEAA